MENKHTPGPWEACIGESGSFDVVGPTVGIPANKQLVICCRAGHNSRGREMESNARLIAAAPDLLAALKLMMEWSCGGGELTAYQIRELEGKALSAASAAIAKAEGGAK